MSLRALEISPGEIYLFFTLRLSVDVRKDNGVLRATVRRLHAAFTEEVVRPRLPSLRRDVATMLPRQNTRTAAIGVRRIFFAGRGKRTSRLSRVDFRVEFRVSRKLTRNFSVCKN